MPSIVHGCGKKLHFPREMAGRKGRCPNCGGAIEVPIESVVLDARPGLAPVPFPMPGAAPAPAATPPAAPKAKEFHLDPPPHWEQYQAFIDGKGPNPRPLMVPANLMLKDEADAKWSAAEKKGAPSKYFCPGCRDRLEVGAFVCMKCGLDLRSGFTLDGKTKVNEKGLEYLKQIGWLQNLPDEATPSKQKPLVPRKKRPL